MQYKQRIVTNRTLQPLNNILNVKRDQRWIFMWHFTSCLSTWRHEVMDNETWDFDSTDFAIPSFKALCFPNTHNMQDPLDKVSQNWPRETVDSLNRALQGDKFHKTTQRNLWPSKDWTGCLSLPPSFLPFCRNLLSRAFLAHSSATLGFPQSFCVSSHYTS